MKYKTHLDELKQNLKFLELTESKTLGKIQIEKGFTIPISRESVKDIEAGQFQFNFFHIVQNMLFCVALCEELPLNEYYRPFLKEVFEKTADEYLQALLDLRFFEDNLYKAGILLGYSHYAKHHDAYLMAAYEFLDLFQQNDDLEYAEIARNQLLKAFKLQKEAYTAYLLSYVCHAKKDYDLAIEYAERALELDPKEELDSAIRGDLKELNLLLDIEKTRGLMQEGDYVQALHYLMDNMDEESWEKKYMLGEIYLALEMPQEALDNLKKALELNPTEPDIYESLGVASYYVGDVTSSITFLEHGLKIDPRHIEILKNLATLYSRTARSDIGIKLLEKAKVFYPEDEEIDVIIDRIKERQDG